MRTDSEEAIRRSIIHSLLGDLDEQESRTLENWLKTPEHQDFYKKISNREYVRCKMAGLELSDKEKARERLKMNIARRIERYRRRKWWGRVAGIVLLLCMGEGVWFYWQNEVKQTDQDLAERVTASSLPVIRLASGKEIMLNRDSAYNWEGGFLLAEDGYARYEPTANVNRADSSQYNEIRTPRGTDYKMILPDGTKVWMNAESVVRFPVVFPTGERRVACDGEVFFDVAVSGLILQTGDRARLEHVFLAEQFLGVAMDVGLIHAREVQVNIRFLVAVEAEEGLERDVVALDDHRLAADRAGLVGQVEAVKVYAIVDPLAVLAVGAQIVRRHRVDLGNAGEVRDGG